MWSELSLSLSALECPKRKPVGLFSLKRDKRNVDFSLRVLQRAFRNVNLDGMGGTVWHKYWGCLIFVRHFPQKLFTKYFHKRTVYFVKSFVRFHKRTVYFVKSFRKCHFKWDRLYEVAYMHRMPYLCRSFSAKEPYISWLFGGK